MCVMSVPYATRVLVKECRMGVNSIDRTLGLRLQGLDLEKVSSLCQPQTGTRSLLLRTFRDHKHGLNT